LSIRGLTEIEDDRYDEEAWDVMQQIPRPPHLTGNAACDQARSSPSTADIEIIKNNKRNIDNINID